MNHYDGWDMDDVDPEAYLRGDKRLEPSPWDFPAKALALDIGLIDYPTQNLNSRLRKKNPR